MNNWFIKVYLCFRSWKRVLFPSIPKKTEGSLRRIITRAEIEAMRKRVNAYDFE